MERFYSQHGEDFILSRLFAGKHDGFFVEVGCIDGRRFSNTLYFEEKGWHGLCVEAHAGYIERLRNNRPNSIVVHAAVGERDADEVTFFANSRGSLSTVDGSKGEQFRAVYGEFFSGFVEQKVVMMRLDSIFRQYGVGAIDILSLDIEGYEVEALKGLDLKHCRPKVCVVESDNVEHEASLDRFFASNRYDKVFKLQQNIFYLDRFTPFPDLHGCDEEIMLINTEHPLDSTGDIISCVRMEIEKNRIGKKKDRFFLEWSR